MEKLEFIEDLSALPDLTDSTLLACLEQRYRKNKVHVDVGQVLLSVHPSLPQESPPNSHLHQLSERVRRGVAENQEDQAILLYGGAGAGKTNTTRQLLRLLLSSSPSKEGVAEKVMDAALLIEALIPEEAQGLLLTSLLCDSQRITGCQFSFLLPDMEKLSTFQVFHWLRCGMAPSRLSSLGLSPSEEGPPHKFPALEEALQRLGWPTALQEGLFATLAAVVHLLGSEDEEAARQLGVDPKDLQELLDCSTGPCIARQLYAHLLRWLVSWLNGELEGEAHRCQIGLVDPPCTPKDGTESGIHRLLTGYVNDVLHNIYCIRQFDWEQEQYVEEGVEWEMVDVESNHTLQQAFEQPKGVLDCLNLSTAEELVDGLNTCCSHTPQACYTGESADSFTISHYTGEHTYHPDQGWCDQNADLPSRGLAPFLAAASNPVTQQLAQSVADLSPDLLLGDSPPSSSLSDRVRWGMRTLCEWITTSHPHFVLCISPHTQKNGEFEKSLVLRQLQQLRVLDTALIQSCGYPVHMSFRSFTKQFATVLMRDTSLEASPETCQQALEVSELQEWRIGKSQVLLKPWHLNQLRERVALYETSARKLQQAFRRNFLRRQSNQLRILDVDAIPEMAVSDGSLDQQEADSTDSSSSSYSPPPPPPRPKHTLSSDELMSPHDYPYLKLVPPGSTANHHPKPERSKSPSPSRKSPRASPIHEGGKKKPSWGKTQPHRSRPQPKPEGENQSEMWFHGKISRDVAEKTLKAMSFNCFLIRASENRIGEFALSLKSHGTVKHFRINTKRSSGRRFELYGAAHSFPSLNDLVEYYQQHCITAEGELLTTPCPIEGSGVDTVPPLPPRRALSSVRRPKSALPSYPTHNDTSTKRAAFFASRPMSLGDVPDLSDEAVSALLKELEIEQRIVEAARRMAELPSGSKRERVKRKQSLQKAQARVLSLRQQYHTVQERRRFLEISMQNTVTSRRVSEPFTPPLPPRRH